MFVSLFLKKIFFWLEMKALNTFFYCCCFLYRSTSPAGQHHSPVSSRHHSSSSQSGSSIQRHSPSPRRKRTPSPSYQRTVTPPLRRSASPYPSHSLSSPQRKQSPPRHRSPMREKGRHDHERTSQSHDRRHERREGKYSIVVFFLEFFKWIFSLLKKWTFRFIVKIRDRRELCYITSL